jgi:hypothetical protein
MTSRPVDPLRPLATTSAQRQCALELRLAARHVAELDPAHLFARLDEFRFGPRPTWDTGTVSTGPFNPPLDRSGNAAPGSIDRMVAAKEAAIARFRTVDPATGLDADRKILEVVHTRWVRHLGYQWE